MKTVLFHFLMFFLLFTGCVPTQVSTDPFLDPMHEKAVAANASYQTYLDAASQPFEKRLKAFAVFVADCEALSDVCLKTANRDAFELNELAEAYLPEARRSLVITAGIAANLSSDVMALEDVTQYTSENEWVLDKMSVVLYRQVKQLSDGLDLLYKSRRPLAAVRHKPDAPDQPISTPKSKLSRDAARLGLTEADFPSPSETPFDGTNELRHAYLKGYRLGVEAFFQETKESSRPPRQTAALEGAESAGFRDGLMRTIGEAGHILYSSSDESDEYYWQEVDLSTGPTNLMEFLQIMPQVP